MVAAITRSSTKMSFGTRLLCCLRRGFLACTLIFLLAEHVCFPVDWKGLESYEERELEKPRLLSNDKNQEISLVQLTAPSTPKQCTNPRHVHIDNIQTHPGTDRLLPPRKIPRIIHQTSRSRCVTERVAWNLRRWHKFPDFQYYFHDDEAMMRLLQQEFPEFSQLSLLVRHCLIHGTVRADLWRYVVLWVYGGIYADIDAVPALFHPEDSIGSADAYFVVEQYHLLSQWFMAVSPRHPIMYYAIQHSLSNLVHVADTGSIAAPLITGPHALHAAYRSFRLDAGAFVDPIAPGNFPVRAGHFSGTLNRTVTIVGVAANQNEYVNRDALGAVKKREYGKMGMRHFQDDKQHPSGKSCMLGLLQGISMTFD